MRVLLASNMYAYPGNWDKLDALSRRVELAVVTPATWNTRAELHPMRQVPQHVDDGSWQHFPVPVYLQGNPFRHVYHQRALAKVLSDFRPELVHVEQEPESLNLLQFGLCRALYRYRLVFVAWENVHPLHQGWLFRRINFELADAGIFGNRAALERCVRMGFRKRAALLPQYGFAAAAQPRAARRAGEPFTVGFAGRLVPEKGIAVLLDALHRLPECRLVVAGSGPLAPSLERDPQVSMLGTLERAQMAEFWQSIDVLAVPSLTTRTWAEQFGRVLLEAMAAGIPVIGSDSGAIPEVIGEAGLVVPEGDAPALADAISRLAASLELYASLAAQALQRAERMYSHEAVTDQTVDLFEEVLGAHSPTKHFPEASHAA